MWHVLIQLEDSSLGGKYNSIFSLFRKSEIITPEVFYHLKVDFIGEESWRKFIFIKF